MFGEDSIGIVKLKASKVGQILSDYFIWRLLLVELCFPLPTPINDMLEF